MCSVKRDLRAEARAIPPPTSEEADAVVEGLSRWVSTNRPRVVLGFLAMPEELDLTPLVDAHPGIRWLVTRAGPRGVLTVHGADAPMEAHPFGFLQPVEEAEKVDPEAIDLVLVPGVLFDRRGGRLGRGAGYYDRFLPRLRPDAETIGVTVERCVIDEVPMEPHDVRIRWLATERGVRRCERPDVADEGVRAEGSG